MASEFRSTATLSPAIPSDGAAGFFSTVFATAFVRSDEGRIDKPLSHSVNPKPGINFRGVFIRRVRDLFDDRAIWSIIALAIVRQVL